MASQFLRWDFLPAGLKADQFELVEDTIQVHSRKPNQIKLTDENPQTPELTLALKEHELAQFRTASHADCFVQPVCL